MGTGTTNGTEGGSSHRHPAVLAWMRLARVYGTTMRGLAEVLREDGLSVAEFDVLAQLGPREGISQQELAARLLVTQANVSYHMQRLVRRGLVARHRDGRRKRLRLTATGAELHERVVPRVEAWHAAQFAALSPTETATLGRLLRTLDRSRRDREPAPAGLGGTP